jgi:hypothetical protein
MVTAPVCAGGAAAETGDLEAHSAMRAPRQGLMRLDAELMTPMIANTVLRFRSNTSVHLPSC